MGNLSVLLLCDVVDSTRLASSMPADAHSALWARHDREARDLIRRWHGREIDKTDGFLLLFDDAADALGFASDYHAALTAIDARLQARIGIHAGEFPLRAAPTEEVARGAKPIEIDGMARRVVARVAGVAPAGATVLCSAAVSALPPLAARSIGYWRMKGLPEPMQLYATGKLPAEAHIEAPKAYRVLKVDDLWLPARLVPHSLPAERDRFVGRRAELEELARRLDEGARLVTLVGIGGTGKTRLAQHFGWMALGDHPGGVWFCDLSQARNLDGVMSAVAHGLSVPLAVGEPATQLAHAIAGHGDCLLIIDNFEQVNQFARATVGAWLDAAPLARVLVTSREVLGVPGEHVLPLAPMTAHDAATLFSQRARAAGSTINASTDSAVAELIELLDRLPLAIELAAARCRLMPPAQLLGRMRDRFSLLVSRGGRHERHATLRATLDWSWDLLMPAERSALAQLSAFEGSFTLAAAESVVDTSACRDSQPLVDLMQQLVEKSLLRQRSAERFDLLMSVRDYAADRLSQADAFPGSGRATQAQAIARHWRYFGGLGEKDCVADGCANVDNLIAACQRAIAARDGHAAANALVATWNVIVLRGPYQLAATMARGLQALSSLDDYSRCRALAVSGSAFFMLGDPVQARQDVDAGLAVAGADAESAAALHCLDGQLLTSDAEWSEAAAALDQALALAQSSARPALLCKVLNALMTLALAQGNPALARAHGQRALEVAREDGDRRWQAGIIGNLAYAEYAEGRLRECLARYREQLALSRDCGDVRWEGNADCNIGLLLAELGEPKAARGHLERSLALAARIGHRRLEATATCNLGIVDEALGRPDLAVVAYERAVSLAVAMSDRMEEARMRIPLALCYARTGRLDQARDCAATAGAVLAAATDVALVALLDCARAEISFRAGDPETAATELERAAAASAATQAHPDSELARRLNEVRALMPR